MAAIYRVGERVDGLYDENTDDMWYPGRIRCVHLPVEKAESDSADATTFEVLYDDGEVERHVRVEFLRQHVRGTICIGTRVLCRYDGGEEFYPGQVSDIQENGRYTIAYDDGEVEEDVPIDHIMEPTDEKKKEEMTDALAPDQPVQQHQEDIQVDVADGSPRNLTDDADSNTDVQEKFNEDSKQVESLYLSKPKSSQYGERSQPASRTADCPDTASVGVPAERAYILDSLQLLEKRLGDAASTKSVLSTLVKQMRAYPQITADLVHEGSGERLIIDALKFHQSHAVIQCYGFVLLRRLCFLCVQSTHFLLRHGIVDLVLQAMNTFVEDAILQASACGALAVFTRVHAGLNLLIEYQVAQLVLSTLVYHKTYSIHTRQVHYYACEVLLELCELDDLQTLNSLCGEQEEDLTGDMSPISLLLFLLRQGLSLDDKKACCAVGSLLMCLAASGRRAAALILSLNGLAELSTVMARYPTEPSIQKYSTAASKQIALCSVRQSPTKRIKETATEILRGAESFETPDKPVTKRSAPRRSLSTGKRKSNSTIGNGVSTYPRGANHTSSGTPSRNSQSFYKVSSPYGQPAFGLGGGVHSYNYPVREYPAAASAPQQPSSLVILDGNFSVDRGFNSTTKRKQLSKEDRQSELFDAYGIEKIPSSFKGRPHGTKRAQLRAHLASAESTWATPHQHISSALKPSSSRSEYFDPVSSHREFISNQPHRWENDTNELHHPTYDPESRQLRGAKRTKKNPATRTAFQVKIENENQLRVSREISSPYPSPQRLGAATKRAAKARQQRITGHGSSSLTGKSSNASSESLNEYATQLFQDNTFQGDSSIPTNSKLTPREKEEIRERERLSFAEKLHKMIDKAKSTLANGNTVSVAMADTAQNSNASANTARKARQVSTRSSEDKHPQPKRTRVLGRSISPRESAETRPAKPTKRAAGFSHTPSAPLVPRPKPMVSRAAITPKATPEPKPQAAAKITEPASTKPSSKQEAVNPTDSDVISPVDNTPVIDNQRQVEADVVIAESGEKFAVSTDEVDPAVSNSDDTSKVEVDIVSSDGAEDGMEKIIKMAPIEAVNVPVDVSLAEDEVAVETTADATVDAAQTSSENAQQSRLTPLDEPSAIGGGSTAIDAMYGDTFSEFDDNGGDEELTVDARDDIQSNPTLVTAPSTDILLQGSKSGEALYDDGYEEFDEDASPSHTEETEAEDAPAAANDFDKEEGEASDFITSIPTEIESDSVANFSEVEGALNERESNDDVAVPATELEVAQDPQCESTDVSSVPDIDQRPELDTHLVLEPNDEFTELVAAASDEKTDINILSDENVSDKGYSEDVDEVELDTDAGSSTSVIESTELGRGLEDAEPVASIQQDEEKLTEKAQINVHPDEPLSSDESVSSIDEIKKLSVDNSVGSIQSATYDEKFDDEGEYQEAEPSEAVEVSDQQQEDGEALDTEAPVENYVGTTDREEESKAGAANEEESFSDTALEESQEEKVREQESNLDELTETTELTTLTETVAPVEDARAAPVNDEDKSEVLAVDIDALFPAPEVFADKDFDNAAEKADTTESLVPERSDESSEPQAESSESTAIPKSEVVAETSFEVAATEASDTNVNDETESVQDSVIHEADRYDEYAQVDNSDEIAKEDDNVFAVAPPSVDPVASSDPVLVTAERFTSDLPSGSDMEPSEIAILMETEVETKNDGLVADEPNEEASKSEDVDVQVSEEPSDKVDEFVADNTENPAVVEESSPESEPETTNEPAQLDESPLENAADSSIVLDKTDDSVSEVQCELDVATENASEEQVESPTRDEANVDPVSAPESESQAATTSDSQENLISREDKPDTTSEPAGIDLAELVVEPETPSEKLIQLDAASGESDQTAEITGQLSSYTQDEDVFDEDFPQPDVASSEDNEETERETTYEEFQYGNADFDDAENAADESVQDDARASEEAPADSVSAGTDNLLRAEAKESDAMEDAAVEAAGDTVTQVSDQTSVSVDQNTSNTETAALRDEPPVDVALHEEENDVVDTHSTLEETGKAVESVDDPAQPSGGDEAPDAAKDDHLDEAFDEAPAAETDTVVNVDANAPESCAIAESPELVAGSEEPHEDPVTSHELDTNEAVSATDESDLKTDEYDVATAIQVEPTTALTESEQVTSEAEDEKHETEELETVESESEVATVETVECGAAQAEAVKTIQSEPETRKAESINLEDLASGAVEPDSNTTEEPTTVEPLAAKRGLEAVSLDAVESEAVESAPVQESVEENSTSDPVLEESTATQDEVPVDPLLLLEPADSGDFPAIDAELEAPVETPAETNDQSSTEEGRAASETKEDESKGEEEEGVSDPSEDPVEDAPSPSVEAIAVEIAAEPSPDESQDPVQPEAKSIQEVDLSSAIAPSPAEDYVDDVMSPVVAVTHTVEVNNGPVSDALTPEPVEPVVAPNDEEAQAIEHSFGEHDYEEAVPSADEPPTIVQDEAAPTVEEIHEENLSDQDKPEEIVDVPVASDELVIQVEPPKRDEVITVEPDHATLLAASEEPKTEDQYDDDADYNEFDDQENESTTLTSPQSVEDPAPFVPVATEAPATEDEFEEYENEYGEEDKPVESPRVDPVTSTREEEIEDVVDKPEEAEEEETYTDDQDEYNNEYEDDDVPVATNSSPPKDKSNPRAETSADEYEDDNEEENYAEDEIEDVSPPKPAPVRPAPTLITNKSDDEMEEDLGYDSEDAYADSDS